jgi:hypothetical protein
MRNWKGCSGGPSFRWGQGFSLHVEIEQQRAGPYRFPLPTKGGGVLRTIGDVRAYMLALSKEREWLDHWKHAYRLLVHGAGAAAMTQQVHLALSRDGELDVEALESIRRLRHPDR